MRWHRIGSGQAQAVAIGHWRFACHFFENAAEMRHIHIPDRKGDFADPVFWIGEQLLGALHAVLVEQIEKALPCVAVDELGKVPLAYVYAVRDRA